METYWTYMDENSNKGHQRTSEVKLGIFKNYFSRKKQKKLTLQKCNLPTWVFFNIFSVFLSMGIFFINYSGSNIRRGFFKMHF